MIRICRGDSSDFANANSLVLSLNAGINLAGFSARFSFMGIDKDFTPAEVESKILHFSYTSEETAGFCLGRNYATFTLYDPQGRQTTSRNIEVEVFSPGGGAAIGAQTHCGAERPATAKMPGCAGVSVECGNGQDVWFGNVAQRIGETEEFKRLKEQAAKTLRIVTMQTGTLQALLDAIGDRPTAEEVGRALSVLCRKDEAKKMIADAKEEISGEIDAKVAEFPRTARQDGKEFEISVYDNGDGDSGVEVKEKQGETP